MWHAAPTVTTVVIDQQQEELVQLLTEELRAQLPRLYSQENLQDPVVHVKFFTPDSQWTWYVTEGEEVEFWEEGQTDVRFFGYVIGLEREWGYFLLSELESARGPLGLRIERDLHFTPGLFSAVMASEDAARGA